MVNNNLYENVIYSMNTTKHKEAFSTQVKSDVEGNVGKVSSALGSLFDAGSKVFNIVSDTVNAAKNSEASNISLKDLNVVPTCVENVFGKNYVEGVCSPDMIDTDSEMSKIVQEVGKKIIDQSERKDLDFEILVKNDNEDINAYVIPGGKIVLTTGLLKEINKNCNSPEEFKNKLSGTLGYLVARASCSHAVKQVQASGLVDLISKVVKFVFNIFFPSNTGSSTVKKGKKLSAEEKKKEAVIKIVDLSVDLGGKILLNNQKKNAEKEARDLAVKYATQAGYQIDEEELEDTLEIAFEKDESEVMDEKIQENLAKIFPQVTKLFA